MHQHPPTDPHQHDDGLHARPRVAPDDAAAPGIDAILASANAGIATEPPPVSRSARRKAARVQAARTVTVRSGTQRSGSPMTRMFLWGLVGLAALGAIGVMSGAIQTGPPGSRPTDLVGGTDRDGSWSYYHDRDYETRGDDAKFTSDRSRSTDPDEAVLGDTSRWEYDGDYQYGPYGSDAIRRRQSGTATRDPLYSQPAPIQDVFSQYGGDLDPSGGAPVGMAPSNLTSPYYDPYAGYSNPYANRIRLSYGEGVGRGANYVP
ncbi:MAG: hypothetical protein JWM86_2573 [Thermoleophilia bacterium]|nr:hypothetical protein [Thermoleophilia bacterium]